MAERYASSFGAIAFHCRVEGKPQLADLTSVLDTFLGFRDAHRHFVMGL